MTPVRPSSTWKKSGQCDLVAESDQEAIDMTKEILQFIPQNCWVRPEVLKDRG